METKKCIICEKNMVRTEYHNEYTWGNKKYCSWECSQNAIKERKNKKN